jgi:dienelactone hydrolase
MSALRVLCVLILLQLPAFGRPLLAQSLPEKDLRAGPPRTRDTPRAFPAVSSREDWTRRARDIREQVLVSCGLWPMPEKTPLDARVFGRLERDGYSVEKVLLQTHPGFFLGGNLYRPLGQGPGPFPAVLNPHGHWDHGRLEDSERGSVPARCIGLARQGIVAFSYDMVGYNDTGQLGPHRKVFTEPSYALWGLSLMGLQTWNSVRALDFIESLPDVDRSRLGCTGASGGGTQTFILGAIDDRLAAQAPHVMVSHSMQGGCLCENAPGLRVDQSNMEIAASAAPRPQLLVAATGDWTKTTLTIEGPALDGVYRLLDAPDRLRYVLLDFEHNYNRPSREHMYGFFGRWLRGLPDAQPIAELPYTKDPDAGLRVLPDGKSPAGALDQGALAKSLVDRAELARLAPLRSDPPRIGEYRSIWLPAWRRALQVSVPGDDLIATVGAARAEPGALRRDLALGRRGRGDRVPAILLLPEKGAPRSAVVVAHPRGRAAYLDDRGHAVGLARLLVAHRMAVVLLDAFQTGELEDAGAAGVRDHGAEFFTTYNRTDAQERIQDLITACAYARGQTSSRRVFLCGEGRAGLWALLAAPAADLVVADCDAIDSASDETLLARDLLVPSLKRLGGFEGVALLAAPNPLFLHNTGTKFGTAMLRKVYEGMEAGGRYREQPTQAAEGEIALWLRAWAGRGDHGKKQ